MARKIFICLAISRKNNGLCVAGKLISNGIVGEWIRPVACGQGGALAQANVSLQGGGTLQLLETVKMDTNGHAPYMHQRENYVIDSSCTWQSNGSCGKPWARTSLVDTPSMLWCTGVSSSKGINDSAPNNRVYSESLYLIEVSDFCVIVQHNTWSHNLEVRGGFSYNGDDYDLKITCIETEHTYKKKPIGEYLIGDSLLAISLPTAAIHGNFYKLIAGVIPL